MSCSREGVEGKDLSTYVDNPKNGLIKITKTNGWEYKTRYRPTEIIIAGEEGLSGMTEETRVQRRKQLEGTAWFTLSVQREHEQVSPLRFQVFDEGIYNERLNYFLNGAGSDFYLIYSKDTLYPISYHFETTYNLSPKEVMIVGFELPGTLKVPIDDMQLIYIDRVFRNGIIKAYFHQNDLRNLFN